MKIGILTSGGDTPGMNAVIRAAYIQCQRLGHTLVGFKYGWKGLMENITMEIPAGIIDEVDMGGTLLGSARENPYARDDGVDKIRSTFQEVGLDCLIAIGGEDTLGCANKLCEDGLNVIGVPKTIDNDLDATDYTFGFDTAVSIATEAMDRLKTTAKSHERVMVVEVMGRHAGWMTLHSGIAGGAHVILIPEYPLRIEDVTNIIKKRYDSGNPWAIVAVSEGFGFTDEADIDEDAELDEFGHVRLEKQEIGKYIADKIKEVLGVPTRAIVLGHTQRGGPPTANDRVLTTKLGLLAVEMADKGEFSMMPALRGTEVIAVPLQEAVARLKTVDEKSWKFAKQLMSLD
ncbi:MAG: 6-phosphofructokinase [Candidatus Kariarchaeaceae archaeon]|jgi:6-phosphofructokinase 1